MKFHLQKKQLFETFLKRKIVREKQKYSNLLAMYEKGQNTQPVDNLEVNESLNELENSQLQTFDEETKTELMKLKYRMEEVDSMLEKIEVIRKYWSEKVAIAFMFLKVSLHVQKINYAYHVLLVHTLDFKRPTVTNEETRKREGG